MRIKKTIITLILLLCLIITGCQGNNECKHESTTWIIDKEATCGIQGLKHEECTLCKSILNEEIIYGRGHEMHNGECINCHKTMSEGLEYKLYGNDYTIIGIGTCTDYDLIIPSVYNGLPVTSISEKAFIGVSNIISIYIPETIDNIEEFAIVGCANLTSITVDRNNHRYTSGDDYNAIIDTYSNKLILGCATTKIPSSITCIGNYAFVGNDKLTNIEIPNSVTSIGIQAFSLCTSLTNIEIPNSVTSIESWAFSGCTNLTSIEIPKNVIRLEENVFKGCDNLIIYCEAASIPDDWDPYWNEYGRPVYWGVNKEDVIEENKFHYLIINDNAKLIKYVGNDKKIEIPSTITSNSITYNVTSIGCYAFSNSTNLTNVSIPSSVTKIEENAFENCNFEYLFFEGTIEDWVMIEFKNVSSNPISLTNHFYIKNEEGYYELKHITIPSKVTTIKQYAFAECKTLQSITFEKGSMLTSIGENAFYGCDALYKVYYDNTLESWCKISFSSPLSNPMSKAYRFCMKDENGNYEELTKIEIPEEVTKIGDYQFYGFGRILELNISKNVNYIGLSAFSECEYLEKIVVDKNNRYYDSRENSNAIIYYNSLIVGCKKTIIPDSVTSISSFAFEGCNGLLKMTIPDNVEYIDEYAFFNCEGLTEIILPTTKTKISDYAFLGCENLTIYSSFSEQPETYNSNWNACAVELDEYDNTMITKYCDIVWNYKKQ